MVPSSRARIAAHIPARVCFPRLTNGVPESGVREWLDQLDPDTIKPYAHVANEISQSAVRRLAAVNLQLHQQQHQEADLVESTEAVSAQNQYSEEEKKTA